MTTIQLNRQQNLKPVTPESKTGDVVCHTHDTNPPQTPQAIRAFCFDHITDPSTHVVPQPPPPTPNPPPRRDPFLLELGNIELGSKVQFISLADDPRATFEAGQVYELQFTGYDANTRRGTIMLSGAEMENKAIQPGERMIVRVVDDNGNHSDGIFVHVDPNRWAGGGQIDTKDAAGQPIRLTGAPIQYVDGFVKPGQSVAEKTKSTFGATLTDLDPPKLSTEGVTVKTFHWSKSEHEMFDLLSRTNHFANTTVEAGAQWCQTPGNLDTVPLAERPTVAAMGENAGALLLKMLGSLYPDKSPSELQKTPITQAMFGQIAQTAATAVQQAGGRETIVVFANALEPGTQMTVQNNSTGQAIGGAQNDTQRTAIVRLRLNEGDKVTIQFADGNKVAGEPFAFEYDSSCTGGKRGEKGGLKNPLNFRLAASKLELN